ncbi:reticulon-4 receptor-like [Ambystoma mexicanum]|uniref:reticulon-4 receptor-like n=1 Tax=Ambystoma mexicanum TaxID=8296 RepID=UPI0037E71835
MAPTLAQAALSSILLLSVQVWGLQCPESCSCFPVGSKKVFTDCWASTGEPSKITAIPKGFPANTVSIFLVNNRVGALSEFSFQGLDHLYILYLFANKIDSIALRTFSNLKCLSVLDLSYNQLSTLEADHLQPLEASFEELYQGFPANTVSIFLVNNRVGALSEFSFQGLDHLYILYLFANKIDSIALRTFSNLKCLSVLDLSYNQLSTLEADHLQPLEASFEELYQGGNPWH